MSDALVEMSPRMSEAEGLMWRLEKDPYLSSTVATLTVLDSAPDMERLAQRMLRGRRDRAPSPPAGAARARPAAPGVGRRSRLRPLVSPAPPRPRSARRRARPLRPRHAAHRRSVRSHPPAVADGDHRGRERRPGRVCHGGSTTRSWTARAACACRSNSLDFERDAPEKPVPPLAESAAPPPSASVAEIARDVVTSTMRVPLGLAVRGDRALGG